jgi:hypothetical protein
VRFNDFLGQVQFHNRSDLVHAEHKRFGRFGQLGENLGHHRAGLIIRVALDTLGSEELDKIGANARDGWIFDFAPRPRYASAAESEGEHVWPRF